MPETTYDDQFAPATGPAAEAVHKGGVSQSSEPQAAPEPVVGVSARGDERAPGPAAPPVPIYLGDRERSRRVVLEWPMLFDGRTYSAITVRRPNAGEIGRFYEQLVAESAAGASNLVRFPVFYDDDGLPVPSAVLDEMDADDDELVMEVARAFLPRRLLLMAGG